MTTKADLIAQIKAENPTMVATINDAEIELTPTEYEKACNDWADMRFGQIQLEQAALKAKADKEALLAKFGLSADEAKLLLS